VFGIAADAYSMKDTTKEESHRREAFENPPNNFASNKIMETGKFSRQTKSTKSWKLE
jgi:hypothetical protein